MSLLPPPPGHDTSLLLVARACLTTPRVSEWRLTAEGESVAGELDEMFWACIVLLRVVFFKLRSIIWFLWCPLCSLLQEECFARTLHVGGLQKLDFAHHRVVTNCYKINTICCEFLFTLIPMCITLIMLCIRVAKPCLVWDLTLDPIVLTDFR